MEVGSRVDEVIEYRHTECNINGNVFRLEGSIAVQNYETGDRWLQDSSLEDSLRGNREKKRGPDVCLEGGQVL